MDGVKSLTGQNEGVSDGGVNLHREYLIKCLQAVSKAQSCEPKALTHRVSSDDEAAGTRQSTQQSLTGQEWQSTAVRSNYFKLSTESRLPWIDAGFEMDAQGCLPEELEAMLIGCKDGVKGRASVLDVSKNPYTEEMDMEITDPEGAAALFAGLSVRVLVLGESGSGKSALLNQLAAGLAAQGIKDIDERALHSTGLGALDASEEASALGATRDLGSNDEITEVGPPIPLQIDLNAAREMGVRDVDEYLARSFGVEERKFLLAAFRQGRCHVLVDEVEGTEAGLAETTTELLFCLAGSSCKMTLASTFVGGPQLFQHLNGSSSTTALVAFVMQPLSPSVQVEVITASIRQEQEMDVHSSTGSVSVRGVSQRLVLELAQLLGEEEWQEVACNMRLLRGLVSFVSENDVDPKELRGPDQHKRFLKRVLQELLLKQRNSTLQLPGSKTPTANSFLPKLPPSPLRNTASHRATMDAASVAESWMLGFSPQKQSSGNSQQGWKLADKEEFFEELAFRSLMLGCVKFSQAVVAEVIEQIVGRSVSAGEVLNVLKWSRGLLIPSNDTVQFVSHALQSYLFAVRLMRTVRADFSTRWPWKTNHMVWSDQWPVKWFYSAKHRQAMRFAVAELDLKEEAKSLFEYVIRSEDPVGAAGHVLLRLVHEVVAPRLTSQGAQDKGGSFDFSEKEEVYDVHEAYQDLLLLARQESKVISMARGLMHPSVVVRQILLADLYQLGWELPVVGEAILEALRNDKVPSWGLGEDAGPDGNNLWKAGAISALGEIAKVVSEHLPASDIMSSVSQSLSLRLTPSSEIHPQAPNAVIFLEHAAQFVLKALQDSSEHVWIRRSAAKCIVTMVKCKGIEESCKPVQEQLIVALCSVSDTDEKVLSTARQGLHVQQVQSTLLAWTRERHLSSKCALATEVLCRLDAEGPLESLSLGSFIFHLLRSPTKIDRILAAEVLQRRASTDERILEAVTEAFVMEGKPAVRDALGKALQVLIPATRSVSRPLTQISRILDENIVILTSRTNHIEQGNGYQSAIEECQTVLEVLAVAPEVSSEVLDRLIPLLEVEDMKMSAMTALLRLLSGAKTTLPSLPVIVGSLGSSSESDNNVESPVPGDPVVDYADKALTAVVYMVKDAGHDLKSVLQDDREEQRRSTLKVLETLERIGQFWQQITLWAKDNEFFSTVHLEVQQFLMSCITVSHQFKGPIPGRAAMVQEQITNCVLRTMQGFQLCNLSALKEVKGAMYRPTASPDTLLEATRTVGRYGLVCKGDALREASNCLTSLAKSSHAAPVRSEACTQLGNFLGLRSEAEEILKDRLTDADMNIRKASFASLRKLGVSERDIYDSIYVSTRSERPATRIRGVEAIEDGLTCRKDSTSTDDLPEEEVIRELCRLLSDPEAAVRKASMSALRRKNLHGPVLHRLIPLLEDEDLEARELTSIIIANEGIRDARSEVVLVTILVTGVERGIDATTRAAAARALRSSGFCDEGVILGMVKGLLSDPSMLVRDAVLESLENGIKINNDLEALSAASLLGIKTAASFLVGPLVNYFTRRAEESSSPAPTSGASAHKPNNGDEAGFWITPGPLIEQLRKWSAGGLELESTIALRCLFLLGHIRIEE